MFRNSVNLFDIFGFKIKVDPSWLLIAALIVWSLSSSYFPQVLPGLGRFDYVALAIIAMLGLFGSLILHELSHSLVARQFGLEVGGITLFLFGGVAELEQEPKDPRSEFWIAVAGPVMSLALAAGAFGLAHLFSNGNGSRPLYEVISYLATINVVLALFNFVPAFPLDGGRILRAALWQSRDDLLSATKTASRFGSAFGIFLVLMGLLSLFTSQGGGGFWPILIGFFILIASRGSYEQLLVKQALRNQRVSDLMTRNPVTVEADESLEDVVSDLMLKHNVSFVPVVEGEQLLGYVDTDVIHGIDRENWSSTRVSDIYVKLDELNSIDPDVPTEKVFEKMVTSGQRKLMVVSKLQLLGVLTLSDLTRFLAIRQGLGIEAITGSADRKLSLS